MERQSLQCELVKYAFLLPILLKQLMANVQPAALVFFRVNSKETNAVLSLIGMCKKSLAVARLRLAAVCHALFSL